MAYAQQTSITTCHINIKMFALIDWVEQDLMILELTPQIHFKIWLNVKQLMEYLIIAYHITGFFVWVSIIGR